MVKNPPGNAGDTRDSGLIPASGRSPGVGNGNLRQYCCPGKFHGQRSLVSYSPGGCKKSDTTEQPSTRHDEICHNETTYLGEDISEEVSGFPATLILHRILH